MAERLDELDAICVAIGHAARKLSGAATHCLPQGDGLTEQQARRAHLFEEAAQPSASLLCLFIGNVLLDPIRSVLLPILHSPSVF